MPYYGHGFVKGAFVFLKHNTQRICEKSERETYTAVRRWCENVIVEEVGKYILAWITR